LTIKGACGELGSASPGLFLYDQSRDSFFLILKADPLFPKGLLAQSKHGFIPGWIWKYSGWELPDMDLSYFNPDHNLFSY
jgi:hypothetical protein